MVTFKKLENLKLISQVLMTLSFFVQRHACYDYHCVKNVRIRSFSGPYFPAFGLNTEICKANLRIKSGCRKIRTKKTPNTDTFYAAYIHQIRTIGRLRCIYPVQNECVPVILPLLYHMTFRNRVTLPYQFARQEDSGRLIQLKLP